MQNNEIYDFFGHKFDVTKAIELIESNAIKYNKMKLENYEAWAKAILAVDCYELKNEEYILKDNRIPLFNYDPNKAMKLPQEALDKPIIMIKNAKGNNMLIDGHHRLFRAYIDKKTPDVVVISDKKAIKQFYSHSPSLESILSSRTKRGKEQSI